MPVYNKIKKFLDSRKLTPYRFREDVGIANKTAYDLCNNPKQVPHTTVLSKICDHYEIQPGEILEWVPLEKTKEEDARQTEEKV